MPRAVDAGAFRWENPPGRSRYDWDSIADELEAKPMAWMIVAENDPVSGANAVRQGRIARVKPKFGYEVETRNNVPGPPRTCTFYLRYNPDNDSRKA